MRKNLYTKGNLMKFSINICIMNIKTIRLEILKGNLDWILLISLTMKRKKNRILKLNRIKKMRMNLLIMGSLVMEANKLLIHRSQVTWICLNRSKLQILSWYMMPLMSLSKTKSFGSESSIKSMEMTCMKKLLKRVKISCQIQLFILEKMWYQYLVNSLRNR